MSDAKMNRVIKASNALAKALLSLDDIDGDALANRLCHTHNVGPFTYVCDILTHAKTVAKMREDLQSEMEV